MEKNYYKNLRKIILASMIVVPAIPFFLIVFIGYFYFVESLQSHSIVKMNRIVEDHQQMIESFLAERKSDLQLIADTYDPAQLTNRDILEQVFRNLQKKSCFFIDIGVFDQEGMHLAYIGPYELVGKVYKKADWFNQVLSRSYYVSDVFLGYRQIPHFIIAVVKNHDGRLWVLRATIDSSLFSRVVERIRVGKTGEAYIVNTKGELQTMRRSGGELMSRDRDLALPLEIFKGVRTFVENSPTGETYLYAAAWLNGDKWLLLGRQDKSEAFKDLARLTYLVMAVTLFGGLTIVSIALALTRRIIGRMKLVDTQKEELGQQLVVAGRLAEIGEMSAGFAHEINNPLQIIKSELTLTETILDDLKERGDLNASEDTDQIHDCLDQIMIQVDRCGGITQGLLKFARKKESKVGPVELQSFIRNVIQLIENKANVEGIQVIKDLPDGIPPVSADPGLLEQVVVNLLNNAIYAIVEKKGSSGGEIRVAVRLGSDDKVVMSVTDDGSGISPENMKKIFTPFFTTKPVGKGTGLGLPICYGIVTEMGGIMEVVSEKGAGATFSIHLPKAERVSV